MLVQLRHALVLVGIASIFALAQPPQNPKIEIREIKATGCVRQGSPRQCLLLETLDGTTTYSFVTAPKPDLNTVVTIQGKPRQGDNECKEGIPINVTDWQPTGAECER
jgi:hypothetical protein